MDVEQKQADLVDHFVKQASENNAASLSSVIVDAISSPSLFSFSEILAIPSVAEKVERLDYRYTDISHNSSS